MKLLSFSGDFGKLGHGNFSKQKSPRLVEGALKGNMVIGISAGYSHSACVTIDHELYTWGSGDSGRLGEWISTTIVHFSCLTKLHLQVLSNFLNLCFINIIQSHFTFKFKIWLGSVFAKTSFLFSSFFKRKSSFFVLGTFQLLYNSITVYLVNFTCTWNF